MICWLIGLAAVTMLSVTAGGTLRDAITVPDSSSANALARLEQHFPDATAAQAHVVANWGSAPVDSAAVDQTLTLIRQLPTVLRAELMTAPDRHTELITVTYTIALPQIAAADATAALTAAAEPLINSGASTAVGGEIPESVQGPNGIGEAAGVLVAVVVLLLAFGSIVAAGLPLLLAGAGLGVGLCLITLLAAVVDVSTVSPTLASMIGLGVGIDYGLFMIAAQRRNLAAGMSPVTAAGQTTATAGRAVISAGGCVLIGITGLAFCGIAGFAWMGVSAALVIAVTVLAAVTLLPALLGLAGKRIFGRRVRRSGLIQVDTFYSRAAERSTAAVVRRPAASLLVGVIALLALAAPALAMRLGQNDAGSESTGNPTRQAYDMVSAAFGPGTNGPIVVVSDRAADVPAALLASSLEGVAAVSAARVSPDGAVSVRILTAEFGPQDPRTAALIDQLHRILPAGADITGPTASVADLTEVLGDRLWVVIGAVLLATFLLLLVVLRSVLLPLKAVLANLFSVAACYGVMTLAFQTDWGSALMGLHQPVPIPAWAPVVLFAILFGLSMDYELFMVTSIVEQRALLADPRRQIVVGMAATTRIVVCAAAIMIAVAAGFAVDPGVMIKIIGVGLASAILIDVTLVRLLVVPATMALFGAANWWFPSRRSRPTARTPRSDPAPQGNAGSSQHTAGGPVGTAHHRGQVTARRRAPAAGHEARQRLIKDEMRGESSQNVPTGREDVLPAGGGLP